MSRRIRAKLTVSFQEFVDAEREAKEVNRQTADLQGSCCEDRRNAFEHCRKVLQQPRNLRGPSRLPIASRTRAVIAAGQALRVPSLPFTDSESGEVIS